MNMAHFNMLILFHIVTKGNSQNLMKSTAKRRRSKLQIQEEKQKAQLQALEVQNKLAVFDQLQA